MARDEYQFIPGRLDRFRQECGWTTTPYHQLEYQPRMARHSTLSPTRANRHGLRRRARCGRPIALTVTSTKTPARRSWMAIRFSSGCTARGPCNPKWSGAWKRDTDIKLDSAGRSTFPSATGAYYERLRGIEGPLTPTLSFTNGGTHAKRVPGVYLQLRLRGARTEEKSGVRGR